MFGIEWLIIFALGASIGSFLNVVIYRVPAGLSVINPPSRCPYCSHRLKKHENVPVLGWLWLKGRCSKCKSPISPRYPLVEAAMGLLFVLVYWVFGWQVQTLGYWAFLSWLVALSAIDLDTMTLPNPLTKSGLVIGLLFQIGVGWLYGDIVNYLMNGIIGAVLGIWLFDIITIVGSFAFGQAAMGGGDAKLAAMMGTWLGWKDLLIASFLACGVGAFIGGGAIAIGLLSRRQPMPFGPFLALGAALTVFFGEFLWSAYWRLFFPLS
jgi:leader peptidase (prepilin peptidase)/N-methyltransferase